MRHFLTTVLLSSSFAWASEDIQPEVYTGLSELKSGVSETAMVVTAHPLATQAALEILERGGSAVDAAVTAQLVLTLVEPQSSGIGGGAFMLHYDQANADLVMFDGREQAPSAIRESHFLEEDGSKQAFWRALVGGHSVGVPGVVAMMGQAHKEHGLLPWSELFESAIDLAEGGFEVSPRLHLLLQSMPHLDVNPEIRSYFFNENGQPHPTGYVLKNPAYAESLRLIADGGAAAFYTGELAERIVEAVQNDPVRTGLLSLEDLANYRVVERDPVCDWVWDYRVCSASPPSSGGVTVIQQLKILEELDVDFATLGSIEFAHLFAASSNLAFADRNKYLADPDYVVVPIQGMLNEDYLRSRSSLVSDRALLRADAGSPPGAPERLTFKSPEQPSTSHFSIVDKQGNIVSMTTSIEMGFGSRVMAGGFLLNNQLTDFDFVPRDSDGHLVANSVAPGKRPRSSMTPTVVFNADNDPVLVVGSPGGSRIINYTSKAIINYLMFGLEPAQAVAAPNMTARNNGIVELEMPGTPQEVVDGLSAMGYQVRTGDLNSGIHMIAIEGNTLIGGADPRREGTVGSAN